MRHIQAESERRRCSCEYDSGRESKTGSELLRSNWIACLRSYRHLWNRSVFVSLCPWLVLWFWSPPVKSGSAARWLIANLDSSIIGLRPSQKRGILLERLRFVNCEHCKSSDRRLQAIGEFRVPWTCSTAWCFLHLHYYWLMQPTYYDNAFLLRRDSWAFVLFNLEQFVCQAFCFGIFILLLFHVPR